MIKERSQNLNTGDEVKLRLLTYNHNARKNLHSVNKVEIYFKDDKEISESNPNGLVLVDTINNIVEENDDFGGHYSISVDLEDQKYVIGEYVDLWYVEFERDQPESKLDYHFVIHPDLWYTNTEPIIYDFAFNFSPNRLRIGERKWIRIEPIPNIPNSSNFKQYYANLAIASDVKLFLEQECGPCVPEEIDLRMVLEDEPTQRCGTNAIYFLDTNKLELEKGLYNIWFKLEFGESCYISEKEKIQIV